MSDSATRCPDLERLDLDALARPERLEILRHAQDCAPCRQRLLQGAPERVFAFLALEPLPPGVLDRVQEAVRREIGGVPSASGRAAPWRPVRWAAALTAAALLALVMMLPGFWSPLREGSTGSAKWVAHDAPAQPPAQVRVLDDDGTVQVLDLTLGDTQLVMVFDQELDL